MDYHYADPKSGANASHFGNKLFIYGTWGLKDILQDLKFLPCFSHGAIGHRGSFQQAKYLLKVVDWTRVDEIHAHSLGGAAALWIGIVAPRIPVVTYGTFRPFLWVPKKKATAVNYVYHTDLVPRLFWPFYRTYGDKIKVKGKGFHPFTDHVRYSQLSNFGVNPKDPIS